MQGVAGRDKVTVALPPVWNGASVWTKQDFEETTHRLKAVQTALVPKLQELREADEWKRFANASIQEQLCAQMEALRAADDPEAIARRVH